MIRVENLAAFKKLEGESLPPSDWLEISQEMINDFAKATLDWQWLHVDVERAKRESPFKTTIAHGFMSLSLISKFLIDAIEIGGVKVFLNYGLNRVRFPHPVPVGSLLRMHTQIAKVKQQESSGVKVLWDCVVEIKGVEKPACVGQFISIIYE